MEIGFNENLEPCPLCKSKDVYLDKEINKRLISIKCSYCNFSSKSIPEYIWVESFNAKKLKDNLVHNIWNKRKCIKRHKKIQLDGELKGNLVKECPKCAKSDLLIESSIENKENGYFLLKLFIKCNSCGSHLKYSWVINNINEKNQKILYLLSTWNDRK